MDDWMDSWKDIFYAVKKMDVENRMQDIIVFFVLFCISEIFLHDGVVTFLLGEHAIKIKNCQQ